MKGKFHPLMGYGSPEGDWRYGSTLSLRLDGGGWWKPPPVALPPGKGQGTHHTEGLVGPRVGPGEWYKSRCHWESVSRPSRPKRVAIPATLHWPTGNNVRFPERKDGKPFPKFYKINLLLTGDVKDKLELIPVGRWKEKKHRTSNRLTEVTWSRTLRKRQLHNFIAWV